MALHFQFIHQKFQTITFWKKFFPKLKNSFPKLFNWKIFIWWTLFCFNFGSKSDSPCSYKTKFNHSRKKYYSFSSSNQWQWKKRNSYSLESRKRRNLHFEWKSPINKSSWKSFELPDGNIFSIGNERFICPNLWFK